MVGRRPITRSLVKQGFPLETTTPPSSPIVERPLKRSGQQLSLGERFVVALFLVVVFSVLHFVALVGVHWYLPGVGLVRWIAFVFRGFVFWFDHSELLFDAALPFVILGYYTVTIHAVLLVTVFVCFGVAKICTLVKP
jgi:hypothetical protein